MPGVDIAADASAGWSPVLSSPVPVHGRGVSQVPTYNAQVPVPEMEPQTCAGAQNPGWIMHDTRRESQCALELCVAAICCYATYPTDPALPLA